MLKQATGKKKKHESEFPGFLYFLTTNLEQNSKLKKKKALSSPVSYNNLPELCKASVQLSNITLDKKLTWFQLLMLARFNAILYYLTIHFILTNLDEPSIFSLTKLRHMLQCEN